MKFRMIALFLLTVMLFTGCAGGSVERKMDTIEDAVESRADAMEDTIESMVQSEPTQTAASAEPTSAPTAAPDTTAALLTAEEAEAIALADAGLTLEQVTRLHSEYDVDHKTPEYDVEFHHGGYEYDYEIHAETGAILHKEKEPQDR